MLYKRNLVKGKIIKRINRFVVLVEIDGKDVSMRFMQRSGSTYKVADTFEYTAK